MNERNKLLSEIGGILTDALNNPKAKVRQPVTLETYKKENSLSWDAALLNISVGGYSRRIDWDNPDFYIYNPGWNHHPLDLNKMKLFQCDRSVCDDPERYHPTEGDKHAEDWIPTVPPQTEDAA